MSESYQMSADLRMVREDLAPLLADGYRHEIAAIYRDAESNPYSDHSKIHAIITDDLETALTFVEEVDGDDVTGVYVEPNPVGPSCRSASWRRVSATDVLARDHLFFDVERKYKDGPATAEDLRRSRDAVSYLIDQLARRGFPKVPARFGVSGNGYYLIYNIHRMEADDASYELFDHILKAAASLVESKFPTVEVDQSVKDAARLRRISGTVNRKFADQTDQWRRVSLSVKDSPAVPREILEELAADGPASSESTAPRMDVDRYELTPGEQALFSEIMIEAVGQGEVSVTTRGNAWADCSHTTMSRSNQHNLLCGWLRLRTTTSKTAFSPSKTHMRTMFRGRRLAGADTRARSIRHWKRD